EYVQQRSVDVPEYRVMKQSGPDHARKYECAVFIGNKLMGRGTGTSKKAGEQAAAHEALEKLKKNNK
ncbi:MAG: ribonuclease III, partial [Lachnospiraceae bacterium]|nr:ribonuclease III [Lachnospiraceae bacterium]